MNAINISTSDGNELLGRYINKQISVITLSYVDTWEEMQDGTVRVIIYCGS